MRSEALVLRHVGRRVAELRAARGWTQEVFAEQVGIGVGYVQRIEGGKENLTLVTIVRLATVLGTDAVELLTVPASDAPRRGRPRKREA